VSRAEIDIHYMRQCLRLAARARGRTSPNPMVGTVIVRGGRVLATGYHHRVGLAHAEVEALEKVGGRAPGATLYVNIEPCDHHGRTGPCTEAILASGVRRVVVGMIDPNPLVHGRGVRKLRRAGIRVDTGVLEPECRRLNEGFISVMERGRPHLTLKLAATIDGRIATRSGDSAWVSGEAARARVHRLRAEVDAVMVGVGTAVRDDPRLTVRAVRGRDPVRVVVDSRARLPATARMLREGEAPVLVAATERAPAARVRALERAGAEVMRVRARGERVDLAALLAALAARGVLTVLCEGGATLAGALLDANLADKLLVFYSPKIVGCGVPMFLAEGAPTMAAARPLREARWRKVGEDLLLEGYVGEPRSHS
jgi:diaminohydroxyphosphoribosylaminopyrimidine deaminase/5-amino-6-(5-phosphoribosylamino)uracil reductase